MIGAVVMRWIEWEFSEAIREMMDPFFILARDGDGKVFV